MSSSRFLSLMTIKSMKYNGTAQAKGYLKIATTPENTLTGFKVSRLYVEGKFRKQFAATELLIKRYTNSFLTILKKLYVFLNKTSINLGNLGTSITMLLTWNLPVNNRLTVDVIDSIDREHAKRILTIDPYGGKIAEKANDRGNALYSHNSDLKVIGQTFKQNSVWFCKVQLVNLQTIRSFSTSSKDLVISEGVNTLCKNERVKIDIANPQY